MINTGGNLAVLLLNLWINKFHAISDERVIATSYLSLPSLDVFWKQMIRTLTYIISNSFRIKFIKIEESAGKNLMQFCQHQKVSTGVHFMYVFVPAKPLTELHFVSFYALKAFTFKFILSLSGVATMGVKQIFSSYNKIVFFCRNVWQHFM